MHIALEDIVLDSDSFLDLKVKERQRFLGPWLAEGSITLAPGWRGSGKTWLGLSIVDTITRGGSLGPWEVETPVPCLYLDAEMTI